MNKDKGICLVLRHLNCNQEKYYVATFDEVVAEIRDLNGYKYFTTKDKYKYNVYDYATGMIIVSARKTVAECAKYVEDVLPKLQTTFKNKFYHDVLNLANAYRLEHDIPTYEL